MSFELDISKYNNDDLRNIFNLNVNYTLQDIQLNKEILKNRLLSNGLLPQSQQDKIIKFLNNAQTKLLDSVFDLKTKASQSYKTKQELLCIDTKFRKNYYNTSSTDFLYDLPFNLRDVLSITLCEVSIPYSFWSINEKYQNNYFWIEKGMKWYYIRLQNGNYQTNKDIIKQVNHAISISLKYNKDDDSNDNGVFFNVNEQTCQSIFASSDASFNVYFNRKPLDIDNIQINNNFKFDQDVDPGILNRNLMQGLGWILGFRRGEYKIEENDTRDISYSKVVISEGIYDKWNPKNLFFIVDDFANNSNNSVINTFSESIGSSNILARLETNLLFSCNNELTVQNPNMSLFSKRTYNGPVDIKKMRFKLVDEFGRTIDLNNMDFSFAMCISSLHK
tara:strand:- start:503 stop:1675 length:1173 start_codon:yes stop_codon:yes gene_type:complete